jgi:phosphomannomutase
MNTSIFKAYDIRGVYPTDINEEVVAKIGRACAHLFDSGEVVLAHDIRHGSPELMKVLEENIAAEAQKIGKTVSIRAIGLSTTPMFYFLVNNYGASGGCMVTASHNPKEYNGVKMVGPGATMISGTQVLETIESLGHLVSK